MRSASFFLSFALAFGSGIQAGEALPPLRSQYVQPGCRYMLGIDTQCGGTGGNCNQYSECSNATYTDACCPVGQACRYISEQLWQCTILSFPKYLLSPASYTQIQDHAQCGGSANSEGQSFLPSGRWENAACSDTYVCQRSTDDWWSCEPSQSAIVPLAVDPPLLEVPAMSQHTILSFAQQGSLSLQNLIQRATMAQVQPSSSINPAVGDRPSFVLPPGAVPIEDVVAKLPNLGVPSLQQVPGVCEDAMICHIRGIEAYLDCCVGHGQNGEYAPPVPQDLVDPIVPLFARPNISSQPAPRLRISNGIILNDLGVPAQLKGFNWFGFNTGAGCVDGLYAGYSNPHTQVSDFSTVVYRQQLLGFNAVRIPFRFGDLGRNVSTFTNLTQSCMTDTLEEIKGNITNPGPGYSTIDYESLALPEPVAPIQDGTAPAQSGNCNAYLPNDNILNRFLWVIQYFVGQGFYVVLDYHPTQNSQDEAIMASAFLLAQNWMNLWSAIKSLSSWQDGTLQGRLLVDIANEPSIFQIKWDKPHLNTQNSIVYPSWSDLWLTTTTALEGVDPYLLFFLEGTSQDCCVDGVAWGNGFITDRSYLARFPGALDNQNFSTPDDFFLQLAGIPELRDRTIVTPHLFGPNITGWQRPISADDGLNELLYYSFAYLNVEGYANVMYPVLVGEFGSGLDTLNPEPSFQNQADATFLHGVALFSNWLLSRLGVRMPSWFWWSWSANTNSGLYLVGVQPSSDDYPFEPTTTSNLASPLPGQNIQWEKIDNLTTQVPSVNPYASTNAGGTCVESGGGFHLIPWYLEDAVNNISSTSTVPLVCP